MIEQIIPAGPYSEDGVCECYVAQTQGQCSHPEKRDEVVFLVGLKYLDGREAFEVPVVGSEPRVPKGMGWTAFYTPDLSRCVLIPTAGTANYLRKRKYARRIGAVRYSPYGVKDTCGLAELF